MSDTSPAASKQQPQFSIDTWAVIAAFAVIILIIAGTLPRVPW
jgi:hypothetical protein